MTTTTVYFSDGHSDKVYTASVDGGVVQFAWGRRGGTMQTKTEGPMAPAAAELLAAKKLAEKRSKGYVDGEPATPRATAGFGQPGHGGPAMAGSLALVPKPMLLNEIGDEALLRLAADPDWWMQEKHDGNRIILVKRAGSLTSYSRTGRETSALPKPIVEAAIKLPTLAFILDGEIVGDVIYAFDLLEDLTDIRALPYSRRLSLLEEVLAGCGLGIKLIETATDPGAKLAMFGRVRDAGGEGVVLKLSTAPYQPGRPNSKGPALKYKLVATASVIVASQNPQASFNMKLFDGSNVGRCTVTGAKPPIGSVVEVRYLNVSRGGSLYQPVYLGIREDIAPEECTAGQLEFKGEARPST